MGDAAQAGSLEHEVFNRPFKVQPKFESWKTPGNYRRFPGGKELPDKLKVWRVQNTGKTYGGVVSRSWGFDDSPDAEVIVAGYNTGKENGAVGVGRHAGFLQWGYSAPPSKMTEAGKKFFLNCICYIHKFDGKRPLIRRARSDRMNPVRLALLIDRIKDKSFFSRTFTAEQLAKYEGNPEGLAQYYRDDYELIYWDEVYKIDEELKPLGIESNRKVGSLRRIIRLLKDNEHAETARLLLRRYTEESFKTADEWQVWFDKNKDRIFFSDVGGYKFRVVPEGYLE